MKLIRYTLNRLALLLAFGCVLPVLRRKFAQHTNAGFGSGAWLNLRFARCCSSALGAERAGNDLSTTRYYWRRYYYPYVLYLLPVMILPVLLNFPHAKPTVSVLRIYLYSCFRRT